MAEPKIAIDILVNCQTGTNNLKRFNKELDKTISGATKATKATNWLSKGFMRLVGAYFSIRTIKNNVKTGSKLQLLRKSIEGLTKSTQDWEYIKQQAFEKGVDLDIVAKGYRNFFSSARMAGFGKGNIQSMYSDVLLSSRAIGASTQQTEGALLALEQMLSKGTVSMEELRRQLGNAIPGAFEIGAKAMKMTTKEFNEFVKKGQLASAVFVPKFIAQLKKEYADGFKDIAQTVDYGSSQVRVAWQILQEEILTGDLGKNIAEMLTKFANFLQSNELKAAIMTISKMLNILVMILDYLSDNLGIILIYLSPALLGGLLVKVAETLKTIFIWLSATNTTLSLTQKILFRLTFLLLLTQEVVAFFTDKDGLLETALLGKDQSWMDRLGKLVFGLVTLGTLFGLGRNLKGGKDVPKGGKNILKGGKDVPKGGKNILKGGKNVLKGVKGVPSYLNTAAWLATLVEVINVGNQNVSKLGINPMTISPYGAALPYNFNTPQLNKTENMATNITYAPQYKIDATTMTPETLRNVLDERDKSFWSSLVSGTALNKIGVQR